MPNYFDKNHDYLFSKYDLSSVIQSKTDAMQDEISSLDANRLLNTAPSDLASYFQGRYHLESISILRDEMYATEQETMVDVRHDPRRWIDNRNHPVLVPGQRIEIFVPFSGDSLLLQCRANQFSYSPPKAKIRNQELIITFEFPNDSAPDIKQDIETEVNNIEEQLKWAQGALDGYNTSLQKTAEMMINNRRERLLANQNRMANLGIPIKIRTDAPKTYAIAEVRRKIQPTMPPATSAPFEPEPAWTMEHYEHALTIIQSMATLMERTPSAFSKQNEEHLRDQFLFQLNGQFEGRATGETFNLNGKTDILLRESGRNVFIAECKFWKGQKKFTETIDQLLGYTAWRDTKTAILVFNRKTDTSLVLRTINESSQSHPNYKRTLDWKHESGYRYIFHHTGDKNREFILTVLLFHVPE